MLNTKIGTHHPIKNNYLNKKPKFVLCKINNNSLIVPQLGSGIPEFVCIEKITKIYTNK